MSEVAGLLQVGLAADGQPPIAIDRRDVTENLLNGVPHSPRFDAGPNACQWLLVTSPDNLLPLLTQIRDAWHGSGTNISWRSLGDPTAIEVLLQQAQAAAEAQTPAPGVLGTEPQPPSDLFAPAAGPRNDSGFAQ